MDFFSRLSRTDAGQEPTDLAQVRADDALIEALRTTPLFDGIDADQTGSFGPKATVGDAAGETLATSAMISSSDDQVAQLLAAWRQEIDSVPMPAPIDVAVAAAVVQSAPARRRAMRPMLAVTAAIAALLVGSAAIGARSATPNDALWPVTQLLWGDRADSVKAGIDAREGIQQASEAIVAGKPSEAVTALDYVTVIITKVEERDGREEIEEDMAQVQKDLDNATGGRTTTSTTASSTVTLPTAPASTSTPPSTSEVPPPATSADNPTTPDQGSTQSPTSDPIVPPTDPTESTGSTDTPTSSTDETPSSTESTEATTESSTTEATTTAEATVNATTEDGVASEVQPTA